MRGVRNNGINSWVTSHRLAINNSNRSAYCGITVVIALQTLTLSIKCDLRRVWYFKLIFICIG